VASPTQPRAHFWDLLESPKFSLAQAKARLRAGWVLRGLPVEQTYCSAGGAGGYSAYLRGPAGELGQLTDKSLAGLMLQVAPLVEALDQTTITLSVPFGEKDAAKALGAQWDGTNRTWHVRPSHAAQCGRWIAAAAMAKNG